MTQHSLGSKEVGSQDDEAIFLRGHSFKGEMLCCCCRFTSSLNKTTFFAHKTSQPCLSNEHGKVMTSDK